MAKTARAAQGRIPKRGLGVGAAIRRIRELQDMGQEALAQKAGLTQGYLSLVEGGSPISVSEDALGRVTKAMGIEPWVLLAQAAGLKLEQVEQFTEQERIWLDVYRALDSEQREVLLEVATVMRRPSPRKRGR